ncbi:MAG TPA: histidine phosphatase family protein, partial [Chloroflexota bacterium]|nr:histidine phosphatase family protein [Chloroflexota bacterium]
PSWRHRDQPISAKGRTEARKLCSYFAPKAIAAIYVSEYIRTGQTIEYVAQHLNLPVTVDGRLNEIDNGVIEGLSAQQLSQEFPAVWQALRDRDHDFRFPEGESGEEAQQRIRSFFEEQQKNRENIILVSHDGWIRLLMCYLLDIPVYRRWEFQVDTCGMMEIAYQPEIAKWKLVRFNQKLQTE